MNKNDPYVYTLEYPEDYVDRLKAGTVFYVGKGTGRRVHKHEPEALRGVISHKCHVIRKIHANGGKVGKTIIAYFETDEEALMYEIALIFFLSGLANETGGGDGARDLSVEARRKMSDAKRKALSSEEARRKIGEDHKGRLHSVETRKRMSDTRKGRPGTSPSEETRKRMSEAQKRRFHSDEKRQKVGKPQKVKSRRILSEEARRKLSENHKVNPRVQEHIRKLSEAQKGKPKKPLSEETRRRISEACKGRTAPNKGKPFSEETRRKMSEAAKRRKKTA